MLAVLVGHCMWLSFIVFLYCTVPCYITLVLCVAGMPEGRHVFIVDRFHCNFMRIMMTYICYCVMAVELDPDLTVDV